MSKTLGELRQRRHNFSFPGTDDCDRFKKFLFFLQLSKRSATDLCGRNDGNLKVIFPDVEMEDVTNSGLRVRAQPGDYVLVKVRCPFWVFGLHCEMAVRYDNLEDRNFFLGKFFIKVKISSQPEKWKGTLN